MRKKLLLTGLLSLFIFISCETREASKYFDDLNLKLTGVIERIDEVVSSNGFDVVRVRIIHTNIDLYDPRKGRDYYYCIIRNNHAEFYQGDTRGCEPGDTLEVDTRKRLFLVHKGNAPALKKEMILYDNEWFFNYVEKHYQNF